MNRSTMTNEEIIYDLEIIIGMLGNGWSLTRSVKEAIERLAIHDQPPTVEEVADDEECLYFFRASCTGRVWGEYYAASVRNSWKDGDRWMRLPKEGA